VPSFADALKRFGLAGVPQTAASYTFAEQVARFATNPEVSGLLLTIGFLGLLIELQTLHLVAGAVGATALALFFGTHVYAGFSNGLVVGLAVLGLVLILFELHVLPGHGIAGTLGTIALVGLLVVATTLNAGADIGAIAGSINLLGPIKSVALVLPVAVGLLAMQVWGSYRVIASIFRWLTIALFAYIGASLFAVWVTIDFARPSRRPRTSRSPAAPAWRRSRSCSYKSRSSAHSGRSWRWTAPRRPRSPRPIRPRAWSAPGPPVPARAPARSTPSVDTRAPAGPATCSSVRPTTRATRRRPKQKRRGWRLRVRRMPKEPGRVQTQRPAPPG